MTEDPSVTRAVGRLGWTMFIVLTIGYFFVYFHRMAVGVVGDDIIDDVGGSKGILNSVYFWTYTLMQIPCGLMADRFGPRLTSSVFLAVASVGSLLTFSADSFAAVAVGKAMIAVGMAVVYIPLMKIVSMWFPRRDFAVLNGIVIAVGNVGAIAAGGPLRMLADAVGWRDVFLVLGTVTFILAVACAVLIRDHPKDVGLPSVEESEEAETGRPREESSAAKVPMLAGLKLVASGGRRFWPCALAYFMVYGSIMVFQATWAATYFDTVYDFALSASWMITALGIGKIASTVAVGSLVSHGIIKYKRRTMILGGTAFALVWVVLFLFAGEIDSYWFWMAVSTLFGFFGGFMTLSFSQVKEWYPLAVSGTAVAATNIFLFLGASVFTTVSGFIIERPYTLNQFSLMWGLMAIASAAAVVLLIVSPEKKAGDPVFGVGLTLGKAGAGKER